MSASELPTAGCQLQLNHYHRGPFSIDFAEVVEKDRIHDFILQAPKQYLFRLHRNANLFLRVQSKHAIVYDALR